MTDSPDPGTPPPGTSFPPTRPRATTDLSPFPVVVTAELRWGDMDAFGHVNNTLFLRYFEMARVAHFEAIDFQLPRGVGPILGFASCTYIRPLVYPDRIRIGVRATEVGEDRFRQEYVLVSEAQGRVAAVGEGIVVAYDYDRGERSRLPPAVKARIQRLEEAAHAEGGEAGPLPSQAAHGGPPASERGGWGPAAPGRDRPGGSAPSPGQGLP